jgi:type VI secretion system protein ImpC
MSSGKIDVELVSSMEKTQAAARPDAETPFNIAIFGDFSGRNNRGVVESLVNRQPYMIDRDNIDDVLKKLGVEIKLNILSKNSPPIIIKFSELDDFHPDHLFENLDIFQALRETRQGLKDPATFALLAKKFQSEEKKDIPPPLPPLEKGGEEGFEKSIASETPGDLLEQILDESQDKAQKHDLSRGKSDWDTFLQEVVKPHTVPDIEARQAELISKVDAATSELMRMILHHPDFQALEAAWRALHFLVFRSETDSRLKIYVLDMSKDELAADLLTTEKLQSTVLYKVLVEQTIETPNSDPWAVVACDYTFDQTIDDIVLLSRMAKIAIRSGAPFIAAAHPHFIGCNSLSENPDPASWTLQPQPGINHTLAILRKMPEASFLGLALPRFLLRLPYGADTEPVERFDFEEMSPDDYQHDRYLWGNPSFVCAYLLAQEFSQFGWNFQLGAMLDIDGLPLHVYQVKGESVAKPCAEVTLTEQAAEIIIDKGLMPLVSFKNQDRIRLARFQSFADPPSRLSGRWSD